MGRALDRRTGDAHPGRFVGVVNALVAGVRLLGQHLTRGPQRTGHHELRVGKEGGRVGHFRTLRAPIAPPA